MEPDAPAARGRKRPGGRFRLVPGARGTVAIALLLGAGMFALPLAERDLTEVPLLLFVVPVGLGAVCFGLRGGMAAAAAGLVLATAWYVAGDHALGLVGYVSHAGTLVLVGALVGWAVDERRELERAITRHHELSLDLTCTASFDGFFTRVNPAWRRTLGYAPEELLARPFLDFVHPDDREATLAEVARQTAAGEPVLNFQNRYRCLDGSYRWLEWTSQPDAGAKSLYAVARDVTARKQAEEALASYQEMLEQAVRERTSDLQQRTRELEEARLETLRRLALAAEYRDDETFEHTERVGRTSALLARELGLSSGEVELIRQAAPLHDVGKLGISDTILLKPGKLTREEFERVKDHAASGAAILSGSSSDVLRLAEEIALSHHEWWDGSGYPGGLAGRTIPFSGRIVAVADVYDALTHTRPYKEAWPVDRAVEEIRRLCGRQFDPAVVGAFDELDPHALAGLRLAGRPARASDPDLGAVA